MSAKRMLVTGLMMWAAISASATVIPIDEFSGEFYEGFEALGTLGGYPAPISICNGAGSFDDSVAHYVMLANSLWAASTNDYIFPYNGNMMGGSVTGWALFAFETPVQQFGAWIGTADLISGSSVTLRDVKGDVIDAFPITLTPLQWDWFGWQSSTPIASVEIHADINPGKPLVVDDLRANIVPEPATLGLLAVVGLLVSRRR